jgi:hypothetical protein
MLLAFIPAVVMPIVAGIAGHSYSPWQAAKFSLLTFLTGSAAFGAGVLGSSLMQGEYPAILPGVGYVFLIGMMANVAFRPGQYADYVTGRYHMDAHWHLTGGRPWWPWSAMSRWAPSSSYSRAGGWSVEISEIRPVVWLPFAARREWE